MAAYAFTRSAKEDLVDIPLYAQETWGDAQAGQYHANRVKSWITILDFDRR